MANSKYEYVKGFERPDNLLPDMWVVVRIDGRGFHKFSTLHNFTKPNDQRAIDLMNCAAMGVMRDLGGGVGGCVLGYGVSDEFSFILHPSCTLFDRRESKLVSTVVSLFTAHYVHNWSTFFSSSPLQPSSLPSFDSRCVTYPTKTHLRDYLSWRQADCHINNLYNTTFWALVQRKGLSGREAERRLKGTVAMEKHEIMFSLGMNYNEEGEVWRKGSVLFWDVREQESEEREEKKDREVEEKKKPGAEEEEEEEEEQSDAEKHMVEEQKQPQVQDRPSNQPPPSLETQSNPPHPTPSKVIPIKTSPTTTNPTTQKKTRQTKAQKQALKKKFSKARLVVEHVDIIGDNFWEERPWILNVGPRKKSRK